MASRKPVTLPSEETPYGILAFLGLLLRAALAYVAGFALYVGCFQLSQKLGPMLADEGLRHFALFVLIALAIAAILLSLFQPIWSGEVRGFGLMTSFTLLAIAISQATGLTQFDPTAPFDALVREHLNALASFRH
jgi:hypothetical protein